MAVGVIFGPQGFPSIRRPTGQATRSHLPFNKFKILIPNVRVVPVGTSATDHRGGRRTRAWMWRGAFSAGGRWPRRGRTGDQPARVRPPGPGSGLAVPMAGDFGSTSRRVSGQAAGVHAARPGPGLGVDGEWFRFDVARRGWTGGRRARGAGGAWSGRRWWVGWVRRRVARVMGRSALAGRGCGLVGPRCGGECS